MSLSTLLSLAEAMEDSSRRPIYDFGMGMQPRPAPQTMISSAGGLLNPWQCQHPACPTSPINQIVANRHKRSSAAKQRHSSNGPDDLWHMPVAQLGKDGYQVHMDVNQFSPNELSVKVMDNSIVVEGKHEEREDGHGYISRHFVRRYALPKGFEADRVMSSLTSDGVLTVNVPKPQPIADKSKERVVQIQQVGPAHLNVKANAVEQKPEEKKATTNGHNTSK